MPNKNNNPLNNLNDNYCMNKVIVAVVAIVLLVLVVCVAYLVLQMNTVCLDDAGPSQYYTKKSLIDANILFTGFAETKEQEKQVINFINSENPIAITDSYCGMNEYYKVKYAESDLQSVSKESFYDYLAEVMEKEQLYKVQIVIGKPMITFVGPVY